MSQVREVIELLTNIFNLYGMTKFKAELFRLSKFDKNEAVAPLWRLLFEILYFLEHGVLDETARLSLEKIEKEKVVLHTKFSMQAFGYLCKDFARLPEDMSSGSRELLLAIGWLICKKDVMEACLQFTTFALEAEFPESKRVKLSFQQETGDLMPTQSVRQLQLQVGRLRLSVKDLYSLFRERTKLQHKVHQCTEGVSTAVHRSHLSALEAHLLRHTQDLEMAIKQLEQENIKLTALLHWKEKEPAFWKWMESVLELKLKERKMDNTGNLPLVHYNIRNDLLGEVMTARCTLEETILKFEPIIDQLEELWESKQHEVNAKEPEELLSAVNMELNFYISHTDRDFNDSHVFKHNSRCKEPRMVFVKPSSKKSSNFQVFEQAPADGFVTDLVDVESEILTTESHIQILELQIAHKQRVYRDKLNKMASRIHGAICVQPASLTRTTV